MSVHAALVAWEEARPAWDAGRDPVAEGKAEKSAAKAVKEDKREEIG